ELESMGYGNPDNYLVLSEDGTGYMMFLYSIEELNWDTEALRFEFNNETYSVDGDTMKVSYGGNASLTFARSADAPPAKPEIVDASGVVSVTNSSNQNFGEILFVPSTMGFADSEGWPALASGETVELDLSKTGGKFPGRFDLALYDTETGAAVTCYYLELYNGYAIEYTTQDGVPVFVIRDLAGNILTIEAQVE
ncbi:MAG: hypothetical protein IJP92_06335, partial [Lachnospiraceae bacterium]|nr:hypothetical protein [Lachnospiraceae bacterium]